MSTFLLSLGRWCARHATRVLAAWALLIAALGGVVATTGIQLDDTFTISGTESMRGLEVLTDRLPQAAGTSEQVLITSSNGRIENHAPAVNAFALRASQIDGVATVSPPFGDKTAGVASSVSADGTHVLVQVQTDASVGSITTGTTPKAKTVAQDLDTLAERAEAMDPSLTVQRSGNIDQEVGIGISAVELVGVAIAAIVLLITFGSFVAAGTPLIAAAVGVGVGMLGILATASFTDINSTTPVLAVMILPIITATIREIFLQTPTLQEEASLALGATRYEMIRQAVLPFGRSGIISASMPGLGRALGETMAVLMILSPGMGLNLRILQAGQHQTIAANIASQFREAYGLSVNVLIATGLVLFIITFAVNSLARWIIARRSEFSGAS